jgi:hypothetical protein
VPGSRTQPAISQSENIAQIVSAAATIPEWWRPAGGSASPSGIAQRNMTLSTAPRRRAVLRQLT